MLDAANSGGLRRLDIASIKTEGKRYLAQETV
jgi:hypothetical protein